MSHARQQPGMTAGLGHKTSHNGLAGARSEVANELKCRMDGNPHQRISFGAARGVSNAQPLVLECEHKQSRLAAADHDNDGDVDFLVTTNRGPVLLLRNQGGKRNHWLKLRL